MRLGCLWWWGAWLALLAAPGGVAAAEQRAPGGGLAGLLPAWTVERAEQRAAEVCAGLGSDDDDEYYATLAAIYSKGGNDWDDELEGADRLRAIVAAFTRLRMCTIDGAPRYEFAGEPDDAPQGQLPWYAVPGRKSVDHTIVFGHWAAHGLRIMDRVVAPDSGCVWGGELSAVRLPGFATFSQPARD